MGDRALVAYERPDGQYNLHYSHWGASNLRLKHRITPARPFGADVAHNDWAIACLEKLLAGAYDDTGATVSDNPSGDDGPATEVSVTPRVTAISRETAIREHLDFLHHEAFYVVDTDREVTAYRTYWFGLQFDCQEMDLDHPTVGHGALKTHRWHDGQPVGDAHDRGRWTALKDAVGDLLDDGVFTEAEALGYLKGKLIAWTDRRQELLIHDAVTAAPAHPL